jgi:hypothetical protein
VGRVGSSQVAECWVFAVRRDLQLSGLFVLLMLLLESLEVVLAQGFPVKRGESVVAQDSSDFHVSSKNRKLYYHQIYNQEFQNVLHFTIFPSLLF